MGQFDRAGGGVLCCSAAGPATPYCTVAWNTAASGGGGTSTEYDDLTISNCIITNNSADLGGGLFCGWNSTVMLADCAIAENTAIDGGGIACDTDNILIRNCTITRNATPGGGGGGLFCTMDPVIQSSVLWGNTGDQWPEIFSLGGHPIISYSVVLGEIPDFAIDAGGNLDADPLLVAACHLSVNSPAIDAGDPNFVPAEDETDIDGAPRVFNARVDIGADEYQAGNCNHNGVPDEQDIATGSSLDCNANGFPDESEPGGDRDCDGDGVSDLWAIYTGLSQDCNVNGIPDECETPDCNDNEVSDDCDIASGTSQDCNASGIPDECEPGGTADCNDNGVPDLCDIYSAASADCNLNAIPDECELGWDQDCDGDGVSDLCEIHAGTEDDYDLDGILDECETPGVIYVDDDAPDDSGPGDPTLGDPVEEGSLEHPYDAIQQAINAAIFDDEIIVLDGVYAGPGSRGLDFGGRDIYLRSLNGAPRCIIDAEGIARGFRFHNWKTCACGIFHPLVATEDGGQGYW